MTGPLVPPRAYLPGADRHESASAIVRTDADFRRRLKKIVDSYRATGDVPGANGGEIVIGASWLTKGYVIPPKAAGLIIRALPGCTLMPAPTTTGTAMWTLFQVQAADVTIDRVTTATHPTNNTFLALASAEIGTLDGASVSAARLTLERCTTTANYAYDDNSGGLAVDAQFVRNRIIATAIVGGINVDSPRAVILANRLTNPSTITVAANGSYCYIGGNYLDGSNITTNASGGFNTITGNRKVGAFSAFAGTDDSLGGNT